MKALIKKCIKSLHCTLLVSLITVGCSGGNQSSSSISDEQSSSESSLFSSAQDNSSRSSENSSSELASSVSSVQSSQMSSSSEATISCNTDEVLDDRLVHDDVTPLVKIDEQCGRLSYGKYANQGQSNRDNILPDFSYAGYQKGGVALPEVPVAETLTAQAGDNRAQIQAALDRVGALTPDANGFRGAVLLNAGRWEVSDTLTINNSGVVLRGEGQGSGGTTLVAIKAAQHDLIRLEGTGSGLGAISGTTTLITSPYVAVGSRSFAVQDTSHFSVGDLIGVRRTPNQLWLDDLTMTQWGWTTSGYATDFERSITAINGNTITIDIPIVDTIESQYGGGSIFLADMSGRIENSGVENLRLESLYAGEEDELHGWNAIVFSRTTNSWVKQVTSQYFGFSAVSMTNNSSFNTVEEVAQLDAKSIVTGGRRYSFYVSGGVGNLFNRCFAREGRHNFVTGSRVTGPHVWLDCLAVKNNSDEGPHHRWATGLLFDNLSSAYFHVQNREDSGTGHGWAGAQTLFWAVQASSAIVADAPVGAMNWSIGSSGPIAEGSWAPEAPAGIFESHGDSITPRSLYLAQLKDRLGQEAVDAITTPEQREGRIWDQLNGWAGEGELKDAEAVAPVECDGILSGVVCCPAACGQCGGAGCGAAPGGAESCCSSAVLDANRSCALFPSPCVL